MSPFQSADKSIFTEMQSTVIAITVNCWVIDQPVSYIALDPKYFMHLSFLKAPANLPGFIWKSHKWVKVQQKNIHLELTWIIVFFSHRVYYKPIYLPRYSSSSNLPGLGNWLMVFISYSRACLPTWPRLIHSLCAWEEQFNSSYFQSVAFDLPLALVDGQPLQAALGLGISSIETTQIDLPGDLGSISRNTKRWEGWNFQLI